MPIAKQVCVLADWEAKSFLLEKEAPDCARHRHISKTLAFELVGHGDEGYLAQLGINKREPPAKWVGPRHIQMLQDFEWRIVGRMIFPRLQLLPVATDPLKIYKYRLRDLRTRFLVGRLAG